MTASALIIAAPGSGHGKTLVCAGLVRALLQQGKRVVLFKMGPDYLDPLFLAQATGLDVRQLDYWMMGREEIATELSRAAAVADHVIVEGVMGLFDGHHPVAQLAKDFAIPVVVVSDASAMAQTFGALMAGLASYDPEVNVAAVLANKVGSDRHGEMLRESVRPPLTLLGWIKRDERLKIAERHLGIDANASEQTTLAAAAMAEAVTDMLPKLPWKPLSVTPSEQVEQQPSLANKPLHGRRIAIARDPAFSFLYPANVDFLERAGAEVVFFSALYDTRLPPCDALYLPGGYPELHLEKLTANQSIADSIREHIRAEKPCVAECGGMLYLLDHLQWNEERAPMLGLLSGWAKVGSKLAALGYQALPNTSLRGHTFHYASVSDDQPVAYSEYQDGRDGEPLYRDYKTLASFVHWYFASDPERVVSWFLGEFELT